jgi:hypothetical protein
MIGDESGNEIGETLAPFKWRVRLSDKAPHKRLAIVAVGIAAFLIGAVLFRNVLLGVIGFAIIFGSTAEFWLGSLFTIDAKGASVKTGLSITAIEWANVKRINRNEGGIKLSPLDKPGTLDVFRGVYLRYGNNNQENVERALLTFGKLCDIDVVDGSDGRGDGCPGSQSGE